MKTTWGIAFGSIVAWSGVASAQTFDEETTEEETTDEEEETSEDTGTMLADETPTEEAPPAPPAASLSPKISGHVDGTYNYNMISSGFTRFHSFTAPANTFLLNAAHVALTGSDDQVSYAVEIDAGTDALANSSLNGLGAFGLPPSMFDIQEAHVSYVSGSGKLGMKAGKFVTTMGIEVIENTANPTISRGFLFGLAEPVGHVGALGTYKASDELDIAVGLVNGWDVVVDNNSLKTLMAKVGLTQEKLIGTFSLLAGPEQDGNNSDFRIAADATAVIKLNKLDLWVQGNFGRETFNAGAQSTTWFGLGVQPVFWIDDKLSVGARGELFIDGDGGHRAGTGDGVTLINVSAAPAYKLTDNLTMRAELRVDIASADMDVYANRDGEATGMQVLGLTEVLYTFGQ